MPDLVSITGLAAELALGLYAGSLLTEACILVPYWRRMPASEFRRLHGTLGPALFRYFAPLTAGTVLLVLAAALAGGQAEPGRAVAAVLVCAALAIFFGYFRRANAAFAAGNLSDTDLARELVRWERWHRVRTALALAAFAISLAGSSGP